MSTQRRSPQHVLSKRTAWKLQDAKAHFSRLVREAQQHGPQHVTIHGRDAVVILSAAEYARLVPPAEKPSLYELLSNSPLKDLDFEFEPVRSPVRDFEL